MSVQKRGNWNNRGGRGFGGGGRGGGGRGGNFGGNRGGPHFRTNIDFGARGLFVTVDGTNQERAAVREVYNLYDELKAAVHVPAEEEGGDQATAEVLDAADELDAACKETGGPKGGNAVGVPLRQVPTNVRNCLFFQSELPADEVYALCDRIVDTCQQVNRCRFAARCIPVEDCAATELLHLAGSMEKLIHRHFVQQWTGEQPPTYALEFKSRNNDQLSRQDVLNVLDDQIKRVAPLARVNLTTPDLTVLVNVLHKNVLISCVRKYNERRKFSVRPPAEKPAAGDEKTTEKAERGDDDAAEPPSSEQPADEQEGEKGAEKEEPASG